MSFPNKIMFNIAIALLLVLMLLFPNKTDARMLPTRSNEDQLDKLRELLRDILETDSDYHPKIPNSLVEKRADTPLDKDLPSLDDYKTLKEYALPRSSLFPASSLLSDKDLKYLSYKRGLPLRFYGLMKNTGDD